MIPWIREKFAERRARWMAARNKRNENSEEQQEHMQNQDETNRNSLINAEERLQGLSIDQQQHQQQQQQNHLQQEQQQQRRRSITVNTTSTEWRRGSNASERRHQSRRNPSQQLRFYTPELLRRLRPVAATSRSLRSLRSNIETSNIIVNSDNHTLLHPDPSQTPNNSSPNNSSSSIRTSSQATLCSQSPNLTSNNNLNTNTNTNTNINTNIITTSSASASSSHCTLYNSDTNDLDFLKARASNEALENVVPEVVEEESQTLSIHVICPSGRVLVFQAASNKTLTELKNEVLLELSDDSASLPFYATDIRTLNSKYRLIRAEYSGCDLNESSSLSQLNIENNDTLVLVLKRSFQPSNYTPSVTSRPNESQINEATKNVKATSENMPTIDTNEIFQQSNIQFDVRKVLISLAQASAVVLGAGPYAERLIETLKQKIINKKNFQNDTLQCLIDMGFTKEHAEYALKLHNGVYASAIEWLLATQNDKQAIDTAGKSAMQKSESTISASLLKTSDTDVLANTEALLEIVRIYSHRDTPPTQESIESLKSMGFNEDDIMVALKKTCNNKAAACEWLCGNRSGSLIELRDGLSQDSPILKTILEMHDVQYNLGNPKVFLAFLAILENENLLRIWGGDNDTTTVITSILQKYHEEKHILGLNQFYAPQHS